MKKICFEIPEDKAELIEEAKKLDYVTVKKIHPLGASEYIAIFVPAAIVCLEQIPLIIKKLLADREVRVKLMGREMVGTPEEIIATIKEMSLSKEEIENLSRYVEIIGTAKKVLEMDKLIYQYAEEKKNGK